MPILTFILFNLVLVIVGTVVLVVALMITGDEGIDRDTLLKCLGIVGVATMVLYVPYIGPLLAAVIWFAGLMAVFEKSFGDAILVAALCWVMNFGLRYGLAALASTMA